MANYYYDLDGILTEEYFIFNLLKDMNRVLFHFEHNQYLLISFRDHLDSTRFNYIWYLFIQTKGLLLDSLWDALRPLEGLTIAKTTNYISSTVVKSWGFKLTSVSANCSSKIKVSNWSKHFQGQKWVSQRPNA